MLITRNEFGAVDGTPWDAAYGEAQVDHNGASLEASAELRPPQNPLETGPSPIRTRLHVLCALYAYSGRLDQRMSLLEDLEAFILRRAQAMAAELLEDGWRPAAASAV